MSKETGVLVAGLLVFLTPFLGVPGSWRTIILIILGVVIAILGFLLRGEAIAGAPRIVRPSSRRPRSQQAFIESPSVISTLQSNEGEESAIN